MGGVSPTRRIYSRAQCRVTCPLRCKTQADRAETPGRFNRRPNFEAYDRRERKKSRKTALRATVRSLTSSFRTVCKTYASPARPWFCRRFSMH